MTPLLIGLMACALLTATDEEAFYDQDGDDVAYGADCDDADPSVGAGERQYWYVDADQDGFGVVGEGLLSCVPLSGRSPDATDCNDQDGDIHPTAPEICDGVDSDCDFRLDDADEDTIDQPTWYVDADGDGYGDPDAATDLCIAPPGNVPLGTDCDDAEAAVSPAAQELCGGGDEDCDGLIDDDDPNVLGGTTWYTDGDGDGFGDPDAPDVGCLPIGRVSDFSDCDDTHANTNPAAQEVCDAQDLDEDCDGSVDDADGDATGQGRYYIDGDGDQHGKPDAIEYWCDPPTDAVPDGDDCDDLRTDVYPGAPETPYDGVDANCDYESDDDADVDGHDDLGHGGDDCDDTVDTTHPGATETWYDGVDADCDAWSDFDQDKDGYDATAHGGGDCKDTDATVGPGATEVWYDGIDTDCKGDDDWDQDHDGHRVVGKGGDDCDDTVVTTYKGADEFPDGVDSDCDGKDYVCGDTIRRVPLDVALPQAAIIASCPGDTVRISPGTYVGNLTIALDITVEGTGPGVVIEGTGTGPAITMSRATLRHLAVTGGHATTFPGGGGILVNNGSGARLEDLEVHDNVSDSWGGGITVNQSGFVRLTDLDVHDNEGGSGNGLMLAHAGDSRLVTSSLHHNYGPDGGAALQIDNCDRCLVEDVSADDNVSTDGLTGLYISQSEDAVLRRVTMNRNDGGTGIGGGGISNTKNLLLEDVEVSDNLRTGVGIAGLYLTYNDDCVIDGLNVHANQGTGVQFYESTCEVRNAHVWENTGLGLSAGYTPLGFRLEDSVIDRNLGGGFANNFGTVGTYRNLTLQGNRSFAFTSDAPATVENVLVTNTINPVSEAVSLKGAVIHGLVVLGSTRTGMRLYGTSTAEGLVVAGSGASGLHVNDTVSLDHVTVAGNSLAGLVVSGTGTVATFRHTVSAWNLVGIDAYPNTATFASCHFGQNSNADTNNGISIGTSTTGDPRFQSYGLGLDPDLLDLHLAPGSPLRDAGAAADDKDGSRGDIGAYGGKQDWLFAQAWYADADNDTLPDGWEQEFTLSITADSRAGDLEGDGLTNLQEYQLGTSPRATDTDRDDWADKTEVTNGTDPLSPYDP